MIILANGVKSRTVLISDVRILDFSSSCGQAHRSLVPEPMHSLHPWHHGQLCHMSNDKRAWGKNPSVSTEQIILSILWLKPSSAELQFSHSVMSDSLWPHGLQDTRLPCPSPTPGAYSNSCASHQWCRSTTSSSVIPFSHLQSFLASGSFPISQVFPSGGQSIGVSASASVLPMNIQDWFPLGWTGWISLHSKGLSRIFSNTTVQM